MDRIDHTPAPAEAVLRFQQERIVKNLFKEFLSVLEELAHEHDEALDKMEKALPSEHKHFVGLADCLTPEKGDRLRKRVLDRGNDALRSLHEIVNGFEISIK